MHNKIKKLKIQEGQEYVSRSYRLPKDLVDELYTIAYDNKISLNNLITQCLTFALEDIKKDQKNSEEN